MTSLAIIGGGGFRVPLIVHALATSPLRLQRLTLMDEDPDRLHTMREVVSRQLHEADLHLDLRVTADLAEAVRGADVIFVAVRVSGTQGRVSDELLALEHGLLGQETVGVGGMAYALRTIPVARRIAATIAQENPGAWTINFTNPAGVITQAMRESLGRRVVGICDTPIGLLRRARRALGVHPGEDVDFDYLGLNHLGWLRSLSVAGTDLLPDLLADEQRLAGLEEAELMGTRWIQRLGALPNEYLYYYYRHREARAAITARQTRGQFLHAQQADFYRTAATSTDPYTLWDRTRAERDASYMAEARAEDDRFGRDAEEIAQGGYQDVALAAMYALLHDAPARMILNVGNTDTPDGSPVIAGLSEDAVIEVGCTVDADGAHPWPIAPARGDMLGLMAQIKECDTLLLAATQRRDVDLAVRAFALHPLVDSVDAAEALLTAYCAASEQIAAAVGVSRAASSP
ncbi:MAG: 6-phospho-beta-glucosidase [Bowdeniella nasicola]|nr:6-phospho-beta-glucosidase [Bowdeniella nasicola]